MTDTNARISERLKQIIGEQTVTVVALQTRVEELMAENAELKANTEDPVKPAKK